MSISPTEGDVPPHNPELVLAVEDDISDLFSFRHGETLPAELSEADQAITEVTEHTRNLVEHTLPNLGRKTRKDWEKGRLISLPDAIIDGSVFQLSAKHNREDDSVSLTLDRPDVPASGFTLKQGRHGSVITIHSKRDDSLSNEAARLLAANEAQTYIEKYSIAMGVKPNTLAQPPYVPKLHERLAAQLSPNHRQYIRDAIALVAVVGATTGAIAGGAFAYNARQASKAAAEAQAQRDADAFDATHKLPDSATVIHFGETRAVSFGADIDNETIAQARVVDEGYVDGDTKYYYTIRGTGSHILRAMDSGFLPPAQDAPNNCKNIKLPDNASNLATVRVQTTDRDIADNLRVTLNRSDIKICNTSLDLGAAGNLAMGKHQLFFEVNDPSK